MNLLYILVMKVSDGDETDIIFLIIFTLSMLLNAEEIKVYKAYDKSDFVTEHFYTVEIIGDNIKYTDYGKSNKSDKIKDILLINVGKIKNNSAIFSIQYINGKEKKMKNPVRVTFKKISATEIEIQRGIVHQIRNTLKYVPWKDRKEFARDLKMYMRSQQKNKDMKTY